MTRQFHLLTIFDTYLLKKCPDGTVEAGHLIGYEPPAEFSNAIDILYQQMGSEISNSNKKNDIEVIHPSNEQYRSATKAEQEQWVRHILSKGKKSPPIATYKKNPAREAHGSHPNDIRDFKRAHEYDKQFKMAKKIVGMMVDQQREYLRTGNWLDRNKLTVQQISAAIELYSEPTIRRAIRSLNLKLNGNTFPASSLLCSSMRPSLCKLTLKLQREHPHLGAPALANMLNAKGVKVSERSVGFALDQLREHALI